MNIRSITYFCNPDWPLDESALRVAGEFAAAAREVCLRAGYEVQTTRLATVPFGRLLRGASAVEAVELAQSLEAHARRAGLDYVSLGPALPENPRAYDLIPAMLAATENLFACGVMASTTGEISLAAVRACAQVIHRLAPLDENGFANLYFAALANVPPGAPFFPAAYHGEGGPAFAFALEAADLAVEAFAAANGLVDARQRLRAAVERQAQALGRIADELGERFSETAFLGLDFSLAPFPEAKRSLGTAFERLGVSAVGRHGSLAAAALIAETLDQTDFPHTGFSGLMLPVLEDATLAARAAEGVLTVKDLLLFSAVCGTGLDTVPLPGDASVEQLTAVLLDLAVLAARLDKPLTARLMPIPGKEAGDPTDFDFPYFANSRVMALAAEPLGGALAGDAVFDLRQRKQKREEDRMR